MLNGKKVNLRLVKEADLEKLYTMEIDITERGDFDAFVLYPEPKFKSDFKESGFWKEDFGEMLVLDKQENIVGQIVFFKGLKYCDGYEVGYKIYRKNDRGKGYMSEALKLFTSYLFSVKPIARLSLNAFAENIASQKIAEKCGYVYEGQLRKAVFCRGKYFDLNLYSILREECIPLETLLQEL